MNEHGSATVLGAAAVAALVALVLLLAQVVGVVAAKHRAQAAADLAALAAAARSVADGGSDSGADACALATELTRRNGAALHECRADGPDYIVSVRVPYSLGVGSGAAHASARAGPSQ